MCEWVYVEDKKNERMTEMAHNEAASKEFMALVVSYTDANVAAYDAAESKARAEWDAIPEGNSKGNAHDNADEMMHTEKLIPVDDTLGWLRAAIDTYNING
jgi:hypothetical protein